MTRTHRQSLGLARGNAGFTLIEMLVSVSLMALIGIALTDGLHLARRSLQSAARIERDSWEILASQRFLRHALESAEPAASGSFAASGALRGDASQLIFRAAGAQSLNEGIPSVFDIRLVARSREPGHQDLVVGWHQQTANTYRNDSDSISSEVLITDVRSVHWQYLSATTPLGDGTGEVSEWLDEWQGRAELPALIRLEVTFSPGGRRVWPLLTVQTRLTHNAGCVFDVVAQDCRKEE